MLISEAVTYQFWLLGICSATVTSSTWIGVTAAVEVTISETSAKLSGLESTGNAVMEKVMEHYCTT